MVIMLGKLHVVGQWKSMKMFIFPRCNLFKGEVFVFPMENGKQWETNGELIPIVRLGRLVGFPSENGKSSGIRTIGKTSQQAPWICHFHHDKIPTRTGESKYREEKNHAWTSEENPSSYEGMN